MWRGGVRLGISVSGPFGCRCLTRPAVLRFHVPLVKPDRRFARIRLSDKDSRVRSREVTLRPPEADQAKLKVQVLGREP
jgi:hypothetical protein